MSFLRVLFQKRSLSWIGMGTCSSKMKLRPQKLVFCLIMIIIVLGTTNILYQHTEFDISPMEMRMHRYPFDSRKFSEAEEANSKNIKNLPHGIVEAKSDMELMPLWLTDTSKLKNPTQDHLNLLAIPAGIRMKKSVDLIVRKFISENFAVILFHYDGNINDWSDLEWSNKAIHIAARNQTKWWFAKRFLHPDVVSIYDYIFLWDEDIGVENFHPRRYLDIMKSEGLEISQPALDPKLSSEVHHEITIRKKKRMVHRSIYTQRTNSKCSNYSDRPPCTGWVEGMAPVFSSSAWHCVWHLIQNDLIHGWGMDMKLGYCVKGDPRKEVGIIDSEFIVHHGIQTLGGSSRPKIDSSSLSSSRYRNPKREINVRIESRRRAKSELHIFENRWKEATKEDDNWIDPFTRPRKTRRPANTKKNIISTQ